MHYVSVRDLCCSLIFHVLQLGINPNKDNPTPEEAWGQLVNRLSYLFSDEVCGLL